MISIHYPSLNKSWGKIPFTNQNTTPVVQQSSLAIVASKKGLTVEEWMRRDGIVSQLARNSPFKVNDRFYPATLEDYEKYGECVVKYLAHTLQAVEQDVWPSHDNPMVITASPLDEDHNHIQFNCTTNYPRKMKPTK